MKKLAFNKIAAFKRNDTRVVYTELFRQIRNSIEKGYTVLIGEADEVDAIINRLGRPRIGLKEAKS